MSKQPESLVFFAHFTVILKKIDFSFFWWVLFSSSFEIGVQKKINLIDKKLKILNENRKFKKSSAKLMELSNHVKSL